MLQAGVNAKAAATLTCDALKKREVAHYLRMNVTKNAEQIAKQLKKGRAPG